MIILPAHPRQALLTSFWLIVSVATGLLTGVSLWLCAGRDSFIGGVGAAGAVGLAGRLWPWLVSFVYRAWNWAARRLTHGGRSALLWICYFVVLLAVGKRGGRFGAVGSTPGGSLWMGRETLSPEAYSMQFDAPTNGAGAEGWVRGYINWAVRSKNLWAISLLPFLVVIAALEEHEQPVLPGTIYTLF